MQLDLLTVPHMVGQLVDNMQNKLDDFQFVMIQLQSLLSRLMTS